MQLFVCTVLPGDRRHEVAITARGMVCVGGVGQDVRWLASAGHVILI
jgi:hypothetical protein